ncbi:solute carrier family 28 member 3-like isoform X2 [Brienomyrus brachyistius]|nr:solute carrier family 28 member 3-like isoform X2 [Brienomyrus brachyistius]
MVSVDMEMTEGSTTGEGLDETTRKPYQRILEEKVEFISRRLEKHQETFWLSCKMLFVAAYIVVVIAACAVNFQRALPLFVITLVAISFLLWDWLMRRYQHHIQYFLAQVKKVMAKQAFYLKWVVYAVLLGALVSWLILDIAKKGSRQLVSFAGLVIFSLVSVLFSKYPFRISWRTLLWGIGLQFLFGILILRTRAGYLTTDWIGKQVEVFLAYTDAGSKFVFGEKFEDHFFAFKILPIVIFFSTVVSMLYYIGFMQWLILKLGSIMLVTMGTSPAESIVAAGNIFVGQSESPLLIRPYISKLTDSEIHAVMAGGFASIAGSVLAAFVSFGIQASHLLNACVMSAPASLAIAKTFWPETDTPRITAKKGFKLEKGEAGNLLEAACRGASTSITLVANMAVNLIAFLALLSFLNAALAWMGSLFDFPHLSFALICSYIFMPFAFLMGVAQEDSFMVAELIGYKTFFNEFVAYDRLSGLIKKRLEGGPEYVDGVKQFLTVHSETIATYALCGFANIGSLGVAIGGLSAMAPDRRSDISRCAIRALISGTMACFMTACMAGILYVPEPQCYRYLEYEHFSGMTNSTELLTCCLDLYASVTVADQSSITTGGGYSMKALRNCCSVLNATSFDCQRIHP